MKGLTLRTVRPGDLKEVYKIERLSFQQPFPPSYLETLAYLSPETFIVASIDEHVVGYSASVLKGLEGHILSIAVHPEYRGLGIGEKVLRENIRRLKELGVRKVVLEVRVSNTAAIQLYKKLGFEISNLLRNYYWDGEDAYEMVLTIGG